LPRRFVFDALGTLLLLMSSDCSSCPKLQQTIALQRQMGLDTAREVEKAQQHRAQVQAQTEELIAEFRREKAALEAELDVLRRGAAGSGDHELALASAKARVSEADAKARALERQCKEERDASLKRAARVKALEDQLQAQGEERRVAEAALRGELEKYAGTLAQLASDKEALDAKVKRLSETVAKRADAGNLPSLLFAVIAVLLWLLLANQGAQRGGRV
jgi:hypothetical protein